MSCLSVIWCSLRKCTVDVTSDSEARKRTFSGMSRRFGPIPISIKNSSKEVRYSLPVRFCSQVCCIKSLILVISCIVNKCLNPNPNKEVSENVSCLEKFLQIPIAGRPYLRIGAMIASHWSLERCKAARG